MRVAIPSDDGTNMASHTGRASGFIVYDIEAEEAYRVEYRSNTYTAHAKGECNEDQHHTHQGYHDHEELLDALHDCQIMIAQGMGPRLVMDLSRRGIEVLFCNQHVADEAAQQYAAGDLVSTGKSSCGH